MAKRIMIAGAVASHPLGGAGNAWAFLQYVLGFRQLGFDTYYVEHIDAQHCIDDDWKPAPFATSANARFFRHVMERFNLSDHAALLEWEGAGSVGLTRSEVETLARDTDLLINGSGRFHLTSVLSAVRRRMYLDLDPGFVQIWQEQYGVDMNLAGHDVHVTVGLNLGAPDCPLPTCGIRWQTTLPPVVLDEWATTAPAGPAYTTVADWRGYSPVEWKGEWYGQKAEEFMRIIELPRRVSVPLELCLAIHPNEPDYGKLEGNGWRLVTPRQHCATPDTYRAYLRGSRGEFTVVKHGYAAGRTGWFSDRSACYLAAGRPVIMQDTGIGSYVPTGTGLLTFTDLESAAEALERVEHDYARQATAARVFAREHLDARRVLSRLAQLAGL
ncbi:MAG: glycosyltransferase [Candidatus Binatia bacterium]